MRNFHFKEEKDDTIPETIFTDLKRLKQILFNLIGNALKFTTKGYIKIKVSK